MIRPALLLASCLLASAAQAGPELLSHRATYALELGRARGGAGVVALDGRLVLEFNAQCEGAVFTQRIVNRVTDADGGRSVTDFSTSSWEARDMTSYRFTSRQTIDGEVEDETSGAAELDGAGKGGEAVFTAPRGRRVRLSPGTIFPTAFTAQIVAAALQGERRIERKLFDGSADVDTYRAIAAIGPRQPAGKGRAVAGSAGAALAEQESWNVVISYYKPDDQEGLPEYEVSFRMFPNGVTGDLILDYGDFSIAGKVSRVDRLPKPRC